MFVTDSQLGINSVLTKKLTNNDSFLMKICLIVIFRFKIRVPLKFLLEQEMIIRMTLESLLNIQCSPKVS